VCVKRSEVERDVEERRRREKKKTREENDERRRRRNEKEKKKAEEKKHMPKGKRKKQSGHRSGWKKMEKDSAKISRKCWSRLTLMMVVMMVMSEET
jgi:hypothetical protein